MLTQLNEKDGVKVRPLPVKDPIDDTGMAAPGSHSERGDEVNDDSSNEILIYVIFAPLISCQWEVSNFYNSLRDFVTKSKAHKW